MTENASTKPNSENRLPTMPGMNEIGTNTAASVAVVASTANTISRVPMHGGGARPGAHGAVARDVLDDDDGVVDDEAGRDDERQQRQDVDREAGRPDGGQRADERHGNGERRRDGGAERAQEGEDDEDDDDGRQHEADDDLAHGFADEDGVVAT